MSSKDIEAGRAHVIIRLRDQVSAGLKHVERSLSGFGRNFATLGAAVTAGSAGALAFPLKMAADMEQLGIGLEIFMGSASAAQAMMKEIATFAKNTPFGLRDVAENAQSLLRARVAASSVIPVLNALGNASNGDQEKLSGLVLAYSQMMGKGKLIAQEANQMNERGLAPMQVLSEATGRSVSDLMQAMEDGAISAEYFTAALQTVYGPGGRLGTILDRQAKSAYGLLGILMDSVSMGLKPLGDAAVSVLKPIASFAIGAADAFGAFTAKNQGLARIVAGVLIGLVAMGGVLTGVGLGAIALSTVFGGLFTALALASAVLGTVFSPMGVAIGGLIWLVVTFRSQIASAFASVVTFLQPVLDGFRRVWAIFQETFGGIVASLMSGSLSAAAGIAWLGFVAAAWTAVDQVNNAVSAAMQFLERWINSIDNGSSAVLTYLGRWIPGVDSVKNYMIQAFGAIGNAILAGRWDLAGAIAMLKLRMALQWGLDSISLAWTSTMTGLGAMWDFMVFGLGRSWAYLVAGWSSGVLMMKTGLNAIVQSVDYLVTSLMILERQAQAATGDKLAAKHVEDYRREFAERTAARNKDLADEESANKRAFNTRIAQQNQQLNQSLMGRVQNEQAVQNAQQQRRMQQQQQLASLESQAAKARAAAGDPTLAGRAAEARAALTAAIAGSKDKENKDPEVKAMQQQVAGGVRQLGTVSSSGTFSAAGAAAAFGFSAAPMVDTAKNTRRLVALAERVRERREARFG